MRSRLMPCALQFNALTIAMHRPKFSVAAVLLVLAAVGVVLSTLLNHWQIAEVERQRDEIMEQTGYIDIRDPTKVYVRELFCPAPETWQVQVYTPPGHELMAGVGVDLPGDENYPRDLLNESYFRRNGQTTITISIFKDRLDRWRVSMYYAFNGSNMIVSKGDFSWLAERDSRINAGSGGEPLHGPVREYEPDQRVPLFLLRNDDATVETRDTFGSLIVWLEPNLLKNFRARYSQEDGD